MRPDLRVPGVHVIGEQAWQVVDIWLGALLTGAAAEIIIQTCFNYPSPWEAYKYASYDELGRVVPHREIWRVHEDG